MRRSARFVVLVGSFAAVFLMGLFGCGSSHARPPVTYEASPDTAGVQRVNVTLHSYYFDPSRIVVRAGHPVELVIHNNSMIVPHNFTIADSLLTVDQGVGLKRTHTVKFTPEHPGEYEFFCHVGSHAKKGMKGVLVVNP
jgi:plastocyanin